MTSKSKKRKKIKLFKIFDIRKFAYDFIKWTGIFPVMLYMRLRINYVNRKKQGRMIKGRCIIIANHSSMSDPLVITSLFWLRRVFYLATKDLFAKRRNRLFFNAIGCIKIDNDGSNVKPFKDAAKVLEDDRCICIFPEGHIYQEGKVHELKLGATMLAIQTNSPIIPVYIQKREGRKNRQKVIVGEKIYVSDYTNNRFPSLDELEKLSELLHSKLEELRIKCE